MIESSRRSFITGLIAFVAAPAIVRAANIMPVKAVAFDFWEFGPDMQVYGRSPAMDALPDARIFIAMVRGEIVHTVISDDQYYDGWAGMRGR